MALMISSNLSASCISELTSVAVVVVVVVEAIVEVVSQGEHCKNIGNHYKRAGCLR